MSALFSDWCGGLLTWSLSTNSASKHKTQSNDNGHMVLEPKQDVLFDFKNICSSVETSIDFRKELGQFWNVKQTQRKRNWPASISKTTLKVVWRWSEGLLIKPVVGGRPEERKSEIHELFSGENLQMFEVQIFLFCSVTQKIRLHQIKRCPESTAFMLSQIHSLRSSVVPFLVVIWNLWGHMTRM